MIPLLPEINLLHKDIDSKMINLPELLKKLGEGGFSGHLNYSAGVVSGGYIFVEGALVVAVLKDGSQLKEGFNAIRSLFEHIATSGGWLNICNTGAELAICCSAMLIGKQLFPKSPVRGGELTEILARQRQQKLDGLLLFTAGERSGAVFYKGGLPLGFYHNLSDSLESSPAEVQKIATLPDACVEIFQTPPHTQLSTRNYLTTVNLEKLWQSVTEKKPDRPAALHIYNSNDTEDSLQPDSVSPHPLIEDLQEVVQAYLGRQGGAMAVRLLESHGGVQLLSDPEKTDRFIEAVLLEGEKIDPEARFNELAELIRSEIAGTGLSKTP